MKKTYAVFGLTEFYLQLRINAQKISAPFSGGQVSGFGIRPATFSTSDPLLQSLIEASPQFRSKKIRLLK